MPDPPAIGAFAIVPNNDLQAAIPFWERLGFMRTGGEGTYIIMAGWLGMRGSPDPGRLRPLGRAGSALPVRGFHPHA